MERAVEVYALVDPRSGVVRYVGRSVDASRRASGHWGERFDGSPKARWLLELEREGLRPDLRVLGVVAGVDAAAAEQRAMDRYAATTLNRMDATCRTRLFSVRLPVEMVEWMAEYAASRGISRTAVANEALRVYRAKIEAGEVSYAAC